MDSQFIPKAIDTVKDAIAADNNQDYELALGLYKKSLEYFMTGLKYEPNPVSLDFALCTDTRKERNILRVLLRIQQQVFLLLCCPLPRF